jgi:hypothetical protein
MQADDLASKARGHHEACVDCHNNTKRGHGPKCRPKEELEKSPEQVVNL